MLARQTNSRRRIADVTSEKQIQRCAEVVFVLQKKWPFLGEVNCESLIHGDLRIFRLDLAEVGIRRHIDHEVIANHELRIHAGLSLRHRMLKKRIARIARVERAESPHHAIRNHFNAPPGRDSFESLKRCRLSQPPLHLVGNVRPEGVFVVANDAAIQNDSPLLLRRIGKAQALEGNREPHHVSLLRHLAA